MKRLLILLLLPSMALASQSYVASISSSGNMAVPPSRCASPTNPALFPITPFNMGGVAKYRITVCAVTGNITAASVRLWLFVPVPGFCWSENDDQSRTFSPIGSFPCTSLGVTADLSNGFIYPQALGCTSDVPGDTFTIRVDG